MTGNENGEVKLFDLKQSTPSICNKKVAHQDSVTSLAIDKGKNSYHLYTGSVNGSIRVFDLRKMECVKEFTLAH